MEDIDTLERLTKILAKLPQEDIYRSVYDHRGNLLASGLEPLQPQLVEDYKTVNFKGKSIVDLGCNFGFFSFLAAERDAKTVLGIDSLPEAVEGAELLAQLKGLHNVFFQTYNFEKPDPPLGTFDLVMLVDFFGRSNIRKKKISSILEFMKTISKKEMLFAIRPLNRIEKDLQMSEDQFRTLYSSQYINAGMFCLLDYITDILGSNWTIKPVNTYDGNYYKYKILFLCRKNASERSL